LGLLLITKSPEGAAEEEDNPSLYCTHCSLYVSTATELLSHLEAKHPPFLQNIFKLFPQAGVTVSE